MGKGEAHRKDPMRATRAEKRSLGKFLKKIYEKKSINVIIETDKNVKVKS